MSSRGALPLILLITCDDGALRAVFTPQEYETTQVCSHEDALSALSRSPALVIIGHDIPEAHVLCARLRAAASPRPPAILMLTPHDEETIEQALAAGASDVLVYPAPVAALRHRVRQLLTTDHAPTDRSERDQRVLAEALRDTAAALNRTLNRDEVLERILEQVGRVVPSDAANIMLVRDGYAQIARARGYIERGEDAVLSVRFPIDSTPSMRWMIETGEPFVLSDVQTYEANWIETPGTGWLRSYISAPIMVDGQISGFINLDSEKANTFTAADANHLRTFADQAATAIRNATLYEALREQAGALEQRVAQRTAQLEQERVQLWTILDSMSDGVIYDENFAVRYVNRAMTALTGYEMDEWTGFLELLRSEAVPDGEFQRIVHSLYQTVEEGSVWMGELRLRHRSGTDFDASLTSTPVVSSSGQTIGAVTVIRDISQEKALQVQKARFVAYASHELRTPIANLKTRLFLLRRQPEEAEQHITRIEITTERMRRLVEDLLDVSRFERGDIALRRQTIVIQTLVNDVLETQQPEADRKQITLRAVMPAEPVRLYADPDRLVQVITNLVVNAINYTLEDGSIVVRVSPPGSINRGDNAVHITVEDSGIGISAENLAHIFQPFFRVEGRVEGTGLGLSITQQIVELHGGDISVESEPRRGSTFRVRLPMITEADVRRQTGAANGIFRT